MIEEIYLCRFFLQLINVLMHELLASVSTALNNKRVFDVTKFDV